MIALEKKYKNFKRKLTSIQWDIPWEVEEKILRELKKEKNKYPASGVNNSIFQFKAQVSQVSPWSVFLLQIISFLSFLYVLVIGVLKRIKKLDKKDIAYFYSEQIFTEKIKKKGKLVCVRGVDLKLNISDIKFLLKVCFKTNFNFIILSTTAFRIGQIRYATSTYQIYEIWANMEYSCSCGTVYDYCEKRGLLLKNFMHGEKLLTLRDSFTKFHEMYVWDQHYKTMFETLQCDARIIIENPWELEEKKTENTPKNKVCYFLKGIETKQEIDIIERSLIKLKNKEFKIYYKKHPRQPNSNNFSSNFIELKKFNNNIPSLYKFDFIISQYSTLMFQCYCNNQKIILDNLSNPKLYKALSDRGYFFAKFKNNDKVIKLNELL